MLKSCVVARHLGVGVEVALAGDCGSEGWKHSEHNKTQADGREAQWLMGCDVHLNDFSSYLVHFSQIILILN